MGSIFSSPFSFSTHVCSYDVFPNFHGADVRKGFLSHLHKNFASKRIKTFDDQKIKRGHTIGPELIKAIKESKSSIVVLSKNYASSSWCLDELVEIVKCREAFGQFVMTIFYDVDPSDVKKQNGDFGKAFEKTCEGKTKEVKQKWSKALALVATIAGEHSLNWNTDAEMIDKITTDVLNYVTPSSENGEMVKIDAHMNELESVGCDDDAKMLGILGVQIGDTTSVLLKSSMGNLKGSWKILLGIDEEEQLPSLLDDIVQHHFETSDNSLEGEGFIFIVDDVSVDNRKKLTTEGQEIVTSFCSASRMIMTTENKKSLNAHGINDIYYWNFESKEEDVVVKYLSEFKKSSTEYAFDKLANSSAEYAFDKLANEIDGFINISNKIEKFFDDILD